MRNDCRACRIYQGVGDRVLFPPHVVVGVKALACELPYKFGLPLSRLSVPELKREVIGRGIVAEIGDVTLWRWLNEDAIRPWRYRSWIFPRDPNFAEKASRVLDLYDGVWEGLSLGPKDFIISADEKTSIQARIRRHRSIGPSPGKPTKIEFEYERGGALAYLAAWDVKRAKIFGVCETKSGIVPFERLISLVMEQEPYHSASRVFWVMDNGSSHRGAPCIKRLKKTWPKIVPVHLPVHASWLNQIEIYFSVVQRKVLTPNDFNCLGEVEERLMGFQERYEKIAKPFEWKFKRKDLSNLMSRLSAN